MKTSNTGTFDLRTADLSEEETTFAVATADFDPMPYNKLISKAHGVIKTHCRRLAGRLHCKPQEVFVAITDLNLDKVGGAYEDRKNFEFSCPAALKGSLYEGKLDESFFNTLKLRSANASMTMSLNEINSKFKKYAEVCELYSNRTIPACNLHLLEELEEVEAEYKLRSVTNLILELGDVLFTATALELALGKHCDSKEA